MQPNHFRRRFLELGNVASAGALRPQPFALCTASGAGPPSMSQPPTPPPPRQERHTASLQICKHWVQQYALKNGVPRRQFEKEWNAQLKSSAKRVRAVVLDDSDEELYGAASDTEQVCVAESGRTGALHRHPPSPLGSSAFNSGGGGGGGSGKRAQLTGP